MILMYHKVAPDAPTKWWVTVDNFYRHLCELRGYQVVNLDQYDPANALHVVITFDGIYENVLRFAAPLLKHFGYPFELFLSGDHVGKANEFDSVEPPSLFTDKEQLKALTSFGGRLQWHTRSHPKLNSGLSAETIERELSIPDEIRALDPNGFNWFAYPHGEHNAQVRELTKKFFKGAVACDIADPLDRYQWPRVTALNESSFAKGSVGVIIPSYNYGHLMAEAIESVLRQTRQSKKILIVDDFSSDNTEEIGRHYAQKFPSLVTFHRNPQNFGIVKNFNSAVKLLNTDYVCFLGADNRFRSDYLEETAKILDQNSDVAAAYTDFALFGPLAENEHASSQAKFRGENIAGVYYLIRFPEFDQYPREEFEKANIVHGSSMYRRVAFDQINGYSDQTQAEDHNLFFRMVEKGWKAKKAKNTFLEYRKHSLSQANARLLSQAELNLYKEIVRDQRKQIETLQRQLAFRNPLLAILTLPIVIIKALAKLLPKKFRTALRSKTREFLVACEKCEHPIFQMRKLIPKGLRNRVGRWIWKIQKERFP